MMKNFEYIALLVNTADAKAEYQVRLSKIE